MVQVSGLRPRPQSHRATANVEFQVLSRTAPLTSSLKQRTKKKTTMAQQMLQLPEPQFQQQFHRLLATCPIVHPNTYVGATVAPRTEEYLSQQITRRLKDEKKKKKDFRRSQEERKRQQVAAAAEKELQHTPNPRSPRNEISLTQFTQNMTAKLGRGNVSQAQAAQTVQQFLLLQSQFISTMSMEDIDDLAKNY